MKRFTIDDIHALGTCYSYEQLRGLFGQRKYTNAKRIAAREDIDIDDRLLVLVRLLDDKQARTFAHYCAKRVFTRTKRRGTKIPQVCLDALAVAKEAIDDPRFENMSGETDRIYNKLCNMHPSIFTAMATSILDCDPDDAASEAGGCAFEDIGDAGESRENKVQLKKLVELMS